MSIFKNIFKRKTPSKIDKPYGIEKVTQEPLKFGSVREAMEIILKTGTKTEKIQAYLFIAEHLDMLKISWDKKQEFKNKIIFELKKLEAVPKLGELKDVDTLKDLALNANEEVAKNAVKRT